MVMSQVFDWGESGSKAIKQACSQSRSEWAAAIDRMVDVAKFEPTTFFVVAHDHPNHTFDSLDGAVEYFREVTGGGGEAHIMRRYEEQA